MVQLQGQTKQDDWKDGRTNSSAFESRKSNSWFFRMATIRTLKGSGQFVRSLLNGNVHRGLRLERKKKVHDYHGLCILAQMRK